MIRVFLIGVTVLTLAACETTKGAGRDIKTAGDAIEDAAENVQKSF